MQQRPTDLLLLLRETFKAHARYGSQLVRREKKKLAELIFTGRNLGEKSHFSHCASKGLRREKLLSEWAKFSWPHKGQSQDIFLLMIFANSLHVFGIKVSLPRFSWNTGAKLMGCALRGEI